MNSDTDQSADVDRQLGKRLRHLRITTGFTQVQAAHMIGVTHQQFHKYEQGINRITASRLWQCSQAFSVPIDYFFNASLFGYDGGSSNNQHRLVDFCRDIRQLPEHVLKQLAGLVKTMVPEPVVRQNQKHCLSVALKFVSRKAVEM